MTKKAQIQNLSADDFDLYIAMDLSKASWSLAMADRSGRKPRTVGVVAWDTERIQEEVARATKAFGLKADARVLWCEEAGRDGFSVHRYLEQLGWTSVVVDPGSIETSSRKKRAKTDRIDAAKLVMKLRSYLAGDRHVFSIVRVPSEEAEDLRRLTREREKLTKEQTRHRNRIKAALATAGAQLEVKANFVEMLDEVRTPTGREVPCNLRKEVLREYKRLELVGHQLKEVTEELLKAVLEPETPTDRQAAMLYQLKGIGLATSTTLTREFFGWREFENRRQVGAAAGLTGTPAQTGTTMNHDQGIGKAGNKRVRTLMVEIAWAWLRYQPESKLARWYQERAESVSKRSKRKDMVAVARRLLIDLWKYLHYGVVPEGAVFNTPKA